MRPARLFLSGEQRFRSRPDLSHLAHVVCVAFGLPNESLTLHYACRAAYGQRECKRRTLSGPTFNTDLTALGLHKSFYQGET